MAGLRERALSVLPARALSRPGVVAGVIGALFALAAAQRGSLAVHDPDVWWIAATGRDWILRGTIPHTNHYSFTSPDHAWVTHESGFAALYGWGLSHLGPSFFSLFGVLAAAVCVSLALAFALSRSRLNASGAMAALLSIGCTAGTLFAVRPAFASLAFALGMTCIAFGRRWTMARAGAALLLQLVWVNSHGSFVLGLGLLLAAIVTDSSDRRDRVARLLTLAGAALLTLANPYGAELPALVFRYVVGADDGARFLLASIKEFAPIWRAEPPFRNTFDVAALGVVALLALASVARRDTRARGVLVLGLVVAACWQVRHLTLAVLLGPLLLTPLLDGWLEGDSRVAGQAKAGVRTVALAVLPGLLIGLAVWGRARGSRPAAGWIDEDLGGGAIVALVERLPDGARVWTPFPSSGLVIWHGAQRGIRVYYDARNDCYPAEVARNAWRLGAGATSAQEAIALLQESRATAVLVPLGHPRDRDLAGSSGWRETDRAGGWVSYERVAGAVALAPCGASW